ncbi:MtN3 and saliva related transmembrane protein [Thalassovita litoralis]|jgi:MtN3 and saliva related transmembrane protein|uniref:MtN3 and saliva related transmembrane protein n=1 Tax=Thalassovita litoralis TaxID=1010611 RepID=A0A521ABK6_9RHOB|nr:SemiSWEET transporter [Thalassovita litoralis]SMO32141.1 MtN3 and saliva related transmembrane protein [Thalassovita litoralis]
MAIYVGYLAALLGMICWIPQAFQVWRTRDTKSLSLSANLLFLITVSLWLIYGLMITDWPIILANIVSVTAMIAIVAAKLKYK